MAPYLQNETRLGPPDEISIGMTRITCSVARRWLPFVALLLLGTAAEASASSLYDLPRPDTATLENGMEIVVIPDHRSPVVTHMVWYRTGAADEPPGKSGIAHFLEHMMFKGTEKHGIGEFSDLIESYGGRHNAGTSQDYTVYYQRVARERLPLVMELEADRMRNIQMVEEEIVRERDVVLEERRTRTENSPSGLFREQMAAAQYLSHPYGTPIVGWKHEIEALGLDDAQSFYARFYAPNNAILVVSGDVTLETVLPLAEKFYGVHDAVDLQPRARPQEPPQIAARRLTMRHGQVTQPSMQRTYLAPTATGVGSEFSVPLEVLADILGGGSQSRLYQSLVVDKKIATGAGASYNNVSFDRTRFSIFATPAEGFLIEDVETAINELLAEFLAAGPTAEELTLSKNSLVAEAVYARDSQMGLADIFGSGLVAGISIEQIVSWPSDIERVTPEDVLAAAKEVFVLERSVTGYLLPLEDEEVPE